MSNTSLHHANQQDKPGRRAHEKNLARKDVIRAMWDEYLSGEDRSVIRDSDSFSAATCEFDILLRIGDISTRH